MRPTRGRASRLSVATALLLSVAFLALAEGCHREGPRGSAPAPHAKRARPLWDVSAPAPRTPRGRFANPGGPLFHGSFGVRFPFMWRRLGTAFRSGSGAPFRIDHARTRLRERLARDLPTVTWIGHATLLVQIGDVRFLTDPIWSDRPSPISFLGPSRFVAPGIALDHLPAIDFVVISHNHFDHLDLPTLRALVARNPETVFFVPLGNAQLLRSEGIPRVRELDWGHSVEFEALTIHCLPTRHWSKRGIGDDNKALWSSWAVTGPTRRFFFAGDTGYFDGFKAIGEAIGPFDLAAVPIGAYAPRAMMRASHMNPEEAVLAAADLRAERGLGVHFGTFDLSDEPLDEPPTRFRAAAAASSRGEDSAWVLDIGESRDF